MKHEHSGKILKGFQRMVHGRLEIYRDSINRNCSILTKQSEERLRVKAEFAVTNENSFHKNRVSPFLPVKNIKTTSS